MLLGNWVTVYCCQFTILPSDPKHIFLLVLREALLLWYRPQNFSSVSSTKLDYQQTLTWFGSHKDFAYKNLLNKSSDLGPQLWV